MFSVKLFVNGCNLLHVQYFLLSSAINISRHAFIGFESEESFNKKGHVMHIWKGSSKQYNKHPYVGLPT